MELNYSDIGHRIKRLRLAKKLTQDKLAEQINLSTPHMSHIETGSTKVSLPTLVNLANALGCTIDELVCDSLAHARVEFEKELSQELSDCSEEELRIITDIVKSTKKSLRKHRPSVSS